MPPTAIVMDFFGVICSEVAPFWLAKHFSPDRATAIKADLFDAADRGRLSPQALWDRLSALTGVPAGDIDLQWKAYVQVDRRFADALGAWRSPTQKVGLLTNAQSYFVRRILTEHVLEPVFDAIVVSSEIGCAKPDADAYQAILRALRVDPEQAVMVDDNPVNVDGAIAAGMRGVLFTSYEEFCERCLV